MTPNPLPSTALPIASAQTCRREPALAWWRALWRHLWQHDRAAWHAVPDDMAARLSARVTASERRHMGQVCVCIEAALPLADAWRAGRSAARAQVVRQRALAWFGRLHVWDTEHNNGVLIYLLLAERRMEIVADRGLMRHTQAQHWADVVQSLGAHLHAGDVETGLTQALADVSALLVAHWPTPEAQAGGLGVSSAAPNELCDAVVRA